MDIDAHANQIQDFVQGGNYHAALNIALSALNECRREGNQAGIDRFLLIMEGIIKTLAREFGSQEIRGRSEGP